MRQAFRQPVRIKMSHQDTFSEDMGRDSTDFGTPIHVKRRPSSALTTPRRCPAGSLDAGSVLNSTRPFMKHVSEDSDETMTRAGGRFNRDLAAC